MAGINELTPILHHIRVKLYPNYLPTGKGTYIARTDSDKTVSIRDMCSIMVTRAGFDGSFETLYDYVCQFMDEVAYQICDGFTANLGYFTIHPNVGGTFVSPTEVHDHKKHPISFRFGALSKLRSLDKNIDVEVVGIAEEPAYIDQFIDVEDNLINTGFVVGNGFTIHGHNIKIEGDDPACGLYFVPVEDPTKKVKIPRILENNPSKVMGLSLSTGFSVNRIEIVTQHTGGGSLLAAPRTITSPFTLEEI
jgi:hypothetical protein